MIGRDIQAQLMMDLVALERSSFLAVTGRRRVGKTYLVDTVYEDHICFRLTGIQGGSMEDQLANFGRRLAEFSSTPYELPPENWQQAMEMLRQYLSSLTRHKKRVIFIDELPWVYTKRSRFLQMLAHLWNDYLSKESHFILVICGSATSWIAKKVINDKGGLHNRINETIRLQPFTLRETAAFFKAKKIKLSHMAIAELYMTMGGIPFYLENVRSGESPTVALQRMAFTADGLLYREYQNLYKALFENAAEHEAIVEVLANAKGGLVRAEVIRRSGVKAGGPYNRTMEDLIVSGFVVEELPFGKKKRGALYRLVDEYSVFYHRFIKSAGRLTANKWQKTSASQTYKIWCGFAFEALCMRHINQIKAALGIEAIDTNSSSYRYDGEDEATGFQIDMILDRSDKVINLIECKWYDTPFTLDKSYAMKLISRRQNFKVHTKTRKMIFNTLITSNGLNSNHHSIDAVDNALTLDDLF